MLARQQAPAVNNLLTFYTHPIRFGSRRKTDNGNSNDKSRSFDSVSRDETARDFAQDDTFSGAREKNRQRQGQRQIRWR